MGWADVFHNSGYSLVAPQWETETKPGCSGTAGTDSCSDASLEEIFHLVTAEGYVAAFPSTWGEKYVPLLKTVPQRYNLAAGC